MRRIIRALYWKMISVFARISRSIKAVNEGFSPVSGSASTGPYQPLSALRDSVALLGVTAGKIESRLEDLSWSTVGALDRLQHALVIAELSKLPVGSALALIGDRPALAAADDLADLGFIITIFDTVSSSAHRTSAWVQRVPLSQKESANAFAAITIVTTGGRSHLAEDEISAVAKLLAELTTTPLVTCESIGEASRLSAWRTDKKVGTRTRVVELPSHPASTQSRVVFSTQLGE